MDRHMTPPPNAETAAVADDPSLLAKVIDAVHDAGTRLLALYSPDARPGDWNEIGSAGRHNEEASLDGLQAALAAARPYERTLASA